MRTEFSGREMQAVLHLMGMATELFERAAALESKIAAVNGGKRDYAMLKTKTMTLLERIMEQMDIEQLKSLKRQLPALCVTVGVRRVESRNDIEGHYMTMNELNDLVNGCALGCQMCNKVGVEVYKCPLRKVFGRLPATSTKAGQPFHTGGCPYSYMFTGESAGGVADE